jgi:hypothetical protein
MRHIVLLLSVVLSFLVLFPTVCLSQESYADIEIKTPPHWLVRQMQTFAGSVPSRAWVYGRGDEEVMVSVMVTEGIVDGLKGQDIRAIVKLYTEAVATGWGGKVKGEEKGWMAPFCGGEAGYKAEVTFGEVVYDYYGCLMKLKDSFRVVSFVTWAPKGTSEPVISRRLLTLIEAISMK